MSSNLGKDIKVQIFGESHGSHIGAVLDGVPSNYKIDESKIAVQMARRAPGNNLQSTQRKESDKVEIISGIFENKTTGMPICGLIKNSDQHSTDYSNLIDTPRPSHADFTATEKYKNFDYRGSGHFSGRLTAPITFAGALLRQILEQKGICVGGHILSVGNIYDEKFDKENVSNELLNKLNTSSFSVIDEAKKTLMCDEIEKARLEKDSIGGSVEIAVTGLPVGIGQPMCRGLEGVISAALFSIPAVKGVSFGAGFDFCKMRGSEANDTYYYDNDKIKVKGNLNGGILGGISTSMPLVVTVALKPTPSISQEQDTINLKTKQNTTLVIKGRHDPCIVQRAVAPLESAVIIALADLMKEGGLI